MKTVRFYAQSPSVASQAFTVDRENNVIRGVVAMQANVEALGHGLQTDRKTIQMIADLTQADGKPRRQRFGHPGVSENMTGKQVSNAVNFRVVGDNLVHDSYFLESARKSPAFAKDPVDFIMTVAEQSPADFAESVIMGIYSVWIMPDGTEIAVEDEDGDPVVPRPVSAINQLPVIRPVELTYVDWVNEGALTHSGLFQKKEKFFNSGVNSYAEDLFLFVDEFRATYNIPLSEIPAKTKQMMEAYLAQRGQNMSKKIAAGIPAGKISEVKSQLAQSVEGQQMEAQPEEVEVTEATEATEQKEFDLAALQERVAALTQRVEASFATVELESFEGEPFTAMFEERLAGIEEHFSEQLAALTIKFEAVYATQVALLETMEVLTLRQEQLSGEVVETVKVPTQPAQVLAGKKSFAPAAPSASTLSRIAKPEAAFDPTANMTPLERSIYIQRQRAEASGAK